MSTIDTQFATRRNVALQPGALQAALLDRLTRSLGKSPESATARDIYDALSLAVHEELTLRWLATQRRVAKAHVKRVCYFSVEYLPGRSLLNALSSLEGGLMQEARAVLRNMGHDLDEVAAQEDDPGLGNGGLGRLAACFLDSLATLQFPAVGYGIRYDYGIFTQVIGQDGGQREVASSWLRYRNVWEVPTSDARYTVKFGGRVEEFEHTRGTKHRWVDTSDIYAVGFDQLTPGNRGPTVNSLRLWSGRAITPFNIDAFNAGDYAAAVRDQVEAKNLSRVLYPDDSTPQGKELRLKQQFFFVSASLQDILATHIDEGRALASLPDSIAIQLNDTHPTVAVPELMRLLMDEHDLSWADSWAIVSKVFSYTNHTLLPEALETWPVSMFEHLLPRHLQIIYLINRDFLKEVETRFPGDVDRQRRLSIIDDGGGERRVRMAHLAVIASHKVNGVAKLHSELMQKHVFSGFAELYPERFTNVTNGIAVRRWLKQSNPGLSSLLTERLGPAWENDLEELSRLLDAADDAEFRRQFRGIKRTNKLRLADEVMRRTGIHINVDSLFDVQVKRIHEYKRQLLNLLYVITRFQRIRANPQGPWVPRTVIFAGKAAPGYAMAKSIIKLINNVARTIGADAEMRDKLRVAFLPDYDVSLAQKIMPAADLSQQISTAGMEASGTGNMKLSLNGALTIGTLDGANIEIRDHVGAENMFIFGMTAEEVAAQRAAGYRPRQVLESNPELRGTLELIESGFFSPGRWDDARPIINRLLGDGEPYLVLADFAAYCKAQDEVDALYVQEDEWSRKAIVNCLNMGYFSSDRSIRDYAENIWSVKPVM